jgi:hypothetical protein
VGVFCFLEVPPPMSLLSVCAHRPSFYDRDSSGVRVNQCVIGVVQVFGRVQP